MKKKVEVEQAGNLEETAVQVVEVGVEEPDGEVNEILEREILCRAEEAGRREDAKRKQDDGDGARNGARSKKRRKFDKLVNWGEDESSQEEAPNGMDDWLGSYGTHTKAHERLDVTREWLLEPARPDPMTSLK